MYQVLSFSSQRPAAASNTITHLGFVCFANTGECYLRPRWQRSVRLLSADIMTEKLSQEESVRLAAVGKQASWPGAVQTWCLQGRLEGTFQTSSSSSPGNVMGVQQWAPIQTCESRPVGRTRMWRSLCVAGGPAAWQRWLCLWWIFRQGMSAASLQDSGAASCGGIWVSIWERLFPSSYCLYYKGCFGKGCCSETALQRQIPSLLSLRPTPASSVPSSKHGFVKLEMWAVLCLLRCPSQIKPWLSGLVLLLSSVPYGLMFWIYWLWCQNAYWLQRAWDIATTSVVWSSEVVFLHRGMFTTLWVIGDWSGACSVVDPFFCFLVMQFLEFLRFSKMEVMRLTFLKSCVLRSVDRETQCICNQNHKLALPWISWSGQDHFGSKLWFTLVPPPFQALEWQNCDRKVGVKFWRFASSE